MELVSCVLVRLVVSFLPVTNEGRWLLARGGQREGEREGRVRCLVLPSGQAALNQEP